jgi:transcriptional antiterminator
MGMRPTKREQALVTLLHARPHTGSELAALLGVSRRTVVREVATANSKLEAARAARIVSGPNYALEVTSEPRLRALLEEGVTDEELVLLAVLT